MRFLHLATYRAKLAIATSGEVHGHSAPPAANAFSVAASPVGPVFPSPFSPSSVVDTFSSDGPRRFFFNANGTPITPGNFSSTGGQLLQKPDLTAADGVSCAAPGFDPFFGTSAAAPHAGAIAALVKSANPSLTPAQIRTFLTSNAIDIEAPGVDRDSGVGILDAFDAVAATGVVPKAFLLVEAPDLSEDSGDGDGFAEPGECAALTLPLTNGSGSVAATAISATLTTATPGVTITVGTSAYANLSGGATGSNTTPFQISLANTVSCPLVIDFALTVTYAGGASPFVTHVLVRVGRPLWTITTTLDTTVPPANPGATVSTGLQTSRLFRGGVLSSCSAPKPFPGFSGLGTRRYDSYMVSNCSSQTACITARLVQNSGDNPLLFLSAYSPTFNPDNLAEGYAADPGASDFAGFPETVSFNVPAESTFVVVVNELDSGSGIGANYTLSIDGLCLPCTAYTGAGNCCASPPSAVITVPATACAGLSGPTASVPDAGAGAIYSWTVANGTINSAAGTRTISFTPGLSGNVGLAVTVTRGVACANSGTKSVAITAGASCEQTPQALAVDPSGNGVLEPGETAVVSPSWKNITGSVAFTGGATAFTGPAGATYSLADAVAGYGTVGAGETAGCLAATADCFQLGVSAPAARPATHWDATFKETLSTGPARTWTVHVGHSFTDVPVSQAFYKRIETLLHTGITAGCTTTTYCPSATVDRGSMAIFIAKVVAGGGPNIPATGKVGGNAYNCASGGTSLFTDVAPTDIDCKHVHYIASQNVTAGCSPTTFCPLGTITRIEMAAFIAKAIVAPQGGAGIPGAYTDPVSGLSYDCSGANIHFTDVPASNVFCKHVHYLWAKGIVSGISPTLYGPTQSVTRDAMAKFLALGFNLETYGLAP